MRETIADRVIDISTHDLTKRSTKIILWLLIWNYLFQLTTSRRGRQTEGSGNASSRNFNSRPHEEVDDVMQTWYFNMNIISTHDLTKRSTFWTRHLFYLLNHFNSRPHEEVDGLKSFDSLICIKFQLTTSRRGRPSSSSTRLQAFHFNSRPHEEVDHP